MEDTASTSTPPDDDAFDRALVTAAFDLIALHGWSRLSLVAAARDAGLPLDRVRRRFPCRQAVLIRFGAIADQMALAGLVADSTPRDQLLGLLMGRIDALQAHRAGVLALLRDLPRDPATALLLATATLGSMRWMLDAAGIDTGGLLGALRVKGLLAVWLATVHEWRRDESEDLSATMATLDRALNRAEQAENSIAKR